MFKKYIPTYYAQNIYEVPRDFYRKQGIKTLFIDLDNTLASYKADLPDEKARALIEELRSYGYNIIIISNNHSGRVEKYAAGLNLPLLANARKPFAFKIKRVIAEHEIDPNSTILIGDQLITDVRAAKRAKIHVMLTEKLVKEDQWTTHFNRLFDRPIRKYLRKKGRLANWREFYE